MEMIRTIIVALFFAGITVCSYYFLSSSPFPWEKVPGLAGETQDSDAPTVALPAPSLENESLSGENPANSSPFAAAPAPENTDDAFALPALGTLPENGAVNGNGNGNGSDAETLAAGIPGAAPLEVPMNSPNGSTDALPPPPADLESATIAATAPALDTDLPPLEDPTVSGISAVSASSSPFDAAPAPVAASSESRVGTDVSADPSVNDALAPSLNNSTPALNNSAPALDATPVLTLDGTSSPTQNPAAGSMSAGAAPNWNTPPSAGPNGVQNPLRNASGNTVPAGAVAENELSNSPVVPVSVPAQGQDSENAEVREYLKAAAEKIQNGDALEVLRALSPYYGNPRFSEEESAFLTNMLAQAATQVIYSQKSYLETPYTVQEGDTLEKIAASYRIPAEFIARINGISDPAALTVGSQLKVLRGPFQAIVYLDRYEMILTLNGLFAGRFWIGIGGELTMKDGDYAFFQKMSGSVPGAAGTALAFARTTGEPGSSDALYIQTAADPAVIGTRSASGNILMNSSDVESLSVMLGARSSLIMRCVSHRSTPETGVASAPVQVPAAAPINASVGTQVPAASVPASDAAPPLTPAPVPASASVPVSNTAPALTLGGTDSSQGLSGGLPAELPGGGLPAGLPADASNAQNAPTASGADALPMELPASL